MRATHVLIVCFLLCFPFSEQVVNAQNLESPPRYSRPSPEPQIEGNRIIRIPIDALNVTIDDDEKPFHLENLGRRFDSNSLIQFLTGYLTNSGRITIVVHSATKRAVKGEREFNEFLEQLANQQNALIVYMPPPTGDDPDIDLKKYAADFQTDTNGDQELDSATEAKMRSVDELLLFFPTKFPNGNWNPKNLKFEDVYFSAEDGTKLHGWFCPADDARAVVLVAHGNAGNVASRAEWLRYLQTKSRVSVFMFDYRGYGRSEGTPTVEGAIQDAMAARAKLCELAAVKESEMFLMGESLGGAIVVQLAAVSPPRGLILQSTFSSLRDVASVHYPKLSWLVPAKKLDSVAQVVHYRGPLLQSHGNADRTIPYSLGEKLFRAASEPKEFVSIEDADHNDWLTDEYLKQLDGFITCVEAAVK